MKKYKLIKKLPFEFSPEVGYISSPTYPKREPDVHYILGQSFIPKNYPEFWEEVIEKPELCVPVGTKFKHKNDNQIYTISSHQWDVVEISWLFIKQECKTVYKVDVTNQYFSDKIWIICNPLFKTEDGVEIFEGDYFWHVDPWWGVGRDLCGKEFKPFKGYKQFSTKEAAKDYVEMYKPIYSRKDILNNFFPELNSKL